MKKLNLYAMMAAAMIGMEGRGKAYRDDIRQQPPKVTCKDCYFYTGGTYCRRVKHHVNKFTSANGCTFFREK